MLKPIYFTQAMLELGFSQAEIDAVIAKANDIEFEEFMKPAPKIWKTEATNKSTIRSRKHREKAFMARQTKTKGALQKIKKMGTL
jgi:hypothetical protein